MYTKARESLYIQTASNLTKVARRVQYLPFVFCSFRRVVNFVVYILQFSCVSFDCLVHFLRTLCAACLPRVFQKTQGKHNIFHVPSKNTHKKAGGTEQNRFSCSVSWRFNDQTTLLCWSPIVQKQAKPLEWIEV
jgi:hypothetical protein